MSIEPQESWRKKEKPKKLLYINRHYKTAEKTGKHFKVKLW